MRAYHMRKGELQLVTAIGIVFCLFLSSLGCQNADDQYQVITEEMSQSEGTPTEPADDDAEPETDASLTDSGTSPATDDSVSSADSNSAGQATALDVNAPTSADAAEMVEASPEDVNTPTEKVKDFINLEEEIARQERLKKLGVGDSAEDLEPREPKLLVTERDFVKESDSQAWRVSYDDLDLLKILNMQPVPLNAVEYLPDWLTQLEGEKVILRGWMFPPDRSEGIKGFIFVRDNQVCCFGPNAKAYDKLTVRLKSGSTSKFIQGRPFDVIGTFKIDAWIEDERDMKTGKFVEKVGMLYHLEDAEIVDKN